MDRVSKGQLINSQALKLAAQKYYEGVSSLVDVIYQLVGKRTTKLQQMGLVNKSEIEGANKSQISEKARTLYFKPV
jgi:hypothetical protein